ncbi:MAG: phosphoglycerate dehydrogenase [Gemmatimonadetes bacterium]|nr:phosphoglycerate dehydrogenase [Gemmatimonadota bacterium]
MKDGIAAGAGTPSRGVTEAVPADEPPTPRPKARRTRYRVLVLDPLSASGLAPLVDDDRFDLIEQFGLKGAALAEALDQADGVIVRSATKITREVMQNARKLRVIGRAGVGVDNIDVDAATERGIAVLNAPAGNTISAAELVFAMLLALVRRVPAADRSMKAGEWNRKLGGTELYGKTLGLVGAGRIGSAVAQRARAFGMRVIAYDPFLSPDRARSVEIELTELDELVRTADVVSLHVPLNDVTRGLMNEARLAAMKPGALLINAARGGLVDEAALEDALKRGHLSGAALDVFTAEPLPADHSLRSLPNVVLTPHVGAATLEAQENVALEIAEAVRAALVEGDLSRAVNAPALGGETMRRLRPLLDLAERLGRLTCALAAGAIERIDVRYAGTADDGIRPLTAAVLVGVFDRIVGRADVNLVNAALIAQSRGIAVNSTRLARHPDYGEYVEVEVATSGAKTCVAGALLGTVHPRIVRVGDFRVDIRPRGALVVLRNNDVPGVIGRVGTVLGDASINIAEYHQARLIEGGEALAAISIDGGIDESILDELRALPDVREARQVRLD